MWIFPNLPQNVNEVTNSKGPGPCTKNGCNPKLPTVNPSFVKKFVLNSF